MILLPVLAATTAPCIKATDVGSAQLKAWIVADGTEPAVQTWLNEASKRGLTTITADRHVNGKREVSVLLPKTGSYRSIGAVIYLAQASGLTVNMKTEPPICEAEVK